MSIQYYIPMTGSNTFSRQAWDDYWSSMKDFDKYDCFSFSSADFHNPLYRQFIEQTGFNIMDFKEQIEAQSMHPISMGVYQYSRIVKKEDTGQLYLQVPQTGCGVYFKLYEKTNT